MRRPTKCPLCGGKITRVTNAVTKNSYFKCSNEECTFVLGEEYTDAEFYLQGQTLNSTCIKCREPLTIVNGPHGLYPRCTHCACDFEPTMYNGKMYSRWVNARRNSVKEEIENLIEAFNSNAANADDELYDFEAFIHSAPAKECKESKKEKSLTTSNLNLTQLKISDWFSRNKEEVVTSKDIKDKFSIASETARNYMHTLKKLHLIKIVGAKDASNGALTALYQDIEGPLPEAEIHKEGYMSTYEFCEKKRKCSAKKQLMEVLQKNNVEGVIASKGKGLFKGFTNSDLEAAWKEMKSPTEEPEQPHIELSKEASTNEIKDAIVKVFQRNLNKSYTIDELSRELSLKTWKVIKILRTLKENRKIKIVGWNLTEDRRGPVALHYQLSESNLPKLKTTIDNSLYMTVQQFYNKKLNGKRVISLKEMNSKIKKNLTPIPLLINQRAFVGYPVSELKETLKSYIEAAPKTRKRNYCSHKKVEIPVEVEAALIQTAKNSNKNASNPIQKKSFLSVVSSFFKREKVHS